MGLSELWTTSRSDGSRRLTSERMTRLYVIDTASLGDGKSSCDSIADFNALKVDSGHGGVWSQTFKTESMLCSRHYRHLLA